MSSFSIIDTPIAGLKIIERKPIVDSRGFLSRIFCNDQLEKAGWKKSIAQVNETVTIKRGAVRGMHYQKKPNAEMKLVSCLHGEIWDVALDLRHDSPTFLQWHAEKLSAENCRAFMIPEGFAHGFQTLSDSCQLLYLHTMPYMQIAEAGIRPTDPRINISWPLAIHEISARDASHPLLDNQFTGINV
jgi:dTDP-4-dehydrorhamnose 3,5-epimerase